MRDAYLEVFNDLAFHATLVEQFDATSDWARWLGPSSGIARRELYVPISMYERWKKRVLALNAGDSGELVLSRHGRAQQPH